MRSLLPVVLLCYLFTSSIPAFAVYTIFEDETPSPAAPAAPAAPPRETAPAASPIVPAISAAPKNAHVAMATPKKSHKKPLPRRRDLASNCPASHACSSADTHSVTYKIPFHKSKSAIFKETREQLDVLIPRMANAMICITGKPDSSVFNNGYISPLANNRAANIRSYLIQKGVSAKAISVAFASAPDTANPYSADLTITEKAAPAGPGATTSDLRPKVPQTPLNPHSAPSATNSFIAPKQPLTNVSMKKGNPIVLYIARSIAEGSMDPATGAQMILAITGRPSRSVTY